jgi:hypothetical protein
MIDTTVDISRPSVTLLASPLVIIGPEITNNTMHAMHAGNRTFACDIDGDWTKDHSASISDTMPRP